jgi:hypothetical protein
MVQMSKFVVPALAFALLVGGCALFGSGDPLDEASYQSGYGPGCNTGQQRQNQFSDYVDRDEARYKADRSYRAGWNAGFHACGRPLNDTYKGSQPSSVRGGGPNQ